MEAEAVLTHAQGASAEPVAARLADAAAEAVAQGSLGLLRRLGRTAARLGVPTPVVDVSPVG
jgi:hypothetical protein